MKWIGIAFCSLMIILIGWLFGVGGYHIEAKESPYWPEFGYGVMYVNIYHNGTIIYFDDSHHYQPRNADSVRGIVKVAARRFVGDSKGWIWY